METMGCGMIHFQRAWRNRMEWGIWKMFSPAKWQRQWVPRWHLVGGCPCEISDFSTYTPFLKNNMQPGSCTFHLEQLFFQGHSYSVFFFRW